MYWADGVPFDIHTKHDVIIWNVPVLIQVKGKYGYCQLFCNIPGIRVFLVLTGFSVSPEPQLKFLEMGSGSDWFEKKFSCKSHVLSPL